MKRNITSRNVTLIIDKIMTLIFTILQKHFNIVLIIKSSKQTIIISHEEISFLRRFLKIY